MKRSLYIIAVLLVTLLFSSCGTETVSIEDCEWKMRTVMSNHIDAGQNENDFVIVVGEADEVYPDAKIVELALTAKEGNLIVTDVTNGKKYDGTYEVMKETPKSVDYEVAIHGTKGYATVAPTEYYDGTEIPTLPINLGEYSLYFIPKESSNSN